jgi:hypothetical protein
MGISKVRLCLLMKGRNAWSSPAFFASRDIFNRRNWISTRGCFSSLFSSS